MLRCRLDLLGEWRLTADGADIPIRGRKHRALLTFLALEGGRAQSRDVLASLLWGDADDAKARASLRQCLASLRSDLGQHVALLEEVPGQGIAVRSDALEVDVSTFLDTLPTAEPDARLGDVAADLTRFYTGQHGLGGAFEDWLGQTRARLRAAALEGLRAHFSDRSAPPERRLHAARAAYEIDALSEDAVRAIMECETALGRAASALRFYDAFHARLADEMDAEPADATQDLAVAIKLGEGPKAEAPPAPAPAAPAPSPIFSDPERQVTLAVLPLEPLGPGTVPRFTILGMLDRLTGHLASLPGMQVVSSNSTRQFLGERPQPQEMRETLGVDYVLTGSLTIMDGRASVAVQLVETQGARVIWAKVLDYAAEDLLSLRAALPEDIAKVIAPSVDLAELRRTHRLEDDALAPYQMVLRARDLIFGQEPAAFRRAGELLRRAVELGPHFALGHLRLAEWHSLGLWEGRAPDADRDALELHAQRAISLRPDDGRALAFWAHSRFMFGREHDAAIALIGDALAATPNDPETLANCVVALAHGGRAEEAVRLADRALRLSPLDPFLFRHEHFASVARYAAGDFDAASDLGLSCYRRASDYRSNLRATIAALIAAERTEEAEPLVAHHAELEPDFSVEAFVPRHGFRDAADRRLYGDRLLAAGLPA